MQQGNILHFSVMLHDLRFIFHQMLLIVIVFVVPVLAEA
jgi:hypothetical protein